MNRQTQGVDLVWAPEGVTAHIDGKLILSIEPGHDWVVAPGATIEEIDQAAGAARTLFEDSGE